MISKFTAYLENLEGHFFKWTIPHTKNAHRPYFLRSFGLFLLLIILLGAQVAANAFITKDRVLGFATSIAASEVIRQTNDERTKAGFTALAENPALSRAAALKAEDMFDKDYWDHFAPDGTSPWYFFGLVGYKYTWAGENLARDFSTSGGVVSAWMASAGHRANILNSNFTEIGVAAVNGNFQGEDTTLVVQLFGKPLLASVSGGQPRAQTAKLQATLETLPSEQQKQVATASPTQVVAEASEEMVNIPSLVKNLSASQKVTLVLLIFIAILFVIDSYVIFRRRHLRGGSHSFAHAIMVILLIGAVILYGQGSIL